MKFHTHPPAPPLPPIAANILRAMQIGAVTLAALLALTFLASCGPSDADVQRAADYDRQAKAQLTARNFPGAIESFRQAIELDPTNPDYPNNLGVLYLKQGNFVEARAQFEEAVYIDPLYSRGFFNLGLALQKLGNNADAAEAYLTASDIEPNALQTYYNLGIVFARLGDKEKAIHAFSEFLERAPSPQMDVPIKNAEQKIRELKTDA